MPEAEDSSTFLKRYLALKALRENIFLNNPTGYGFLDIVEDIPGAGRGIAPFLSDTLPSAALISKDTEIRRKQVMEAIDKINASKTDKGALIRQMLTNGLTMSAASIPSGAAISGAFNILGLRSPFNSGLRNPSKLFRNLKKLNTSKKYREAIISRVGDDALKSSILGGITGAAVPLVGARANLSQADLEEAAKILHDHPVASSLPAGEVLSSLPKALKEKTTPFQSVGMGAGIGAGMGVLGTLIPPALSIPKELASSQKLKNLKPLFSKAIIKNLSSNVGLLGSLGGLAGYTLSKKYTQDGQTNSTA